MICEICGISLDITEQKKIKDELNKRLKELNCLYGISHLVESGKTVPEILQGIADIVPSSLQYPQISLCEILLDENIIRSQNYSEESFDKCSHIFLSQPIVVNGDISGELRVYHKGERPEADEGPFLREESELINAVAERISKVAEREMNRIALRKSEERFSLAMDASKDGIWEWDLTTGEIYCSPGLTTMLGYDSTDVMKNVETWQNLIHPEDRQKAYQVNIDCVNNLTDSFEVEYRMKTKGGEWRWILGHGKVVHRDLSGNALRIVGTHQNITDRKQAEKALRQAHDLLEERVKERTKKLALTSKSLEEVNSALNVLLRKRDQDNKHFEENILFNVKELIEPQIKNLRNSGLNETQMEYIGALEYFLKEIVSPFSHTLHTTYRELTISEIKVANLIREGKTTKEIAVILGSTQRTIDFHRQNLRKKLGLYNRKINLASHLLSIQE
jgi:PAS domain S-box-containing protein